MICPPKKKDWSTSPLQERIVHRLPGRELSVRAADRSGAHVPQLGLHTALLGGHYAMKWMHLLRSGVRLCARWSEHHVVGVTQVRARRLKWAMAGGYLWDTHDLPPGGMYNAGQKLFFWTVFVPGIVVVISGLIMFNPLAVPVTLARWAYMLHAASVMVIARSSSSTSTWEPSATPARSRSCSTAGLPGNTASSTRASGWPKGRRKAGGIPGRIGGSRNVV